MSIPSSPVRTLGFFDSGQGGLTIWAHLRRIFPGLNTIYLGDNARYPFGTKSASTVSRYTTEAIVSLRQMGADAVVVACGTASSVAVPQLTSLFALPIIGITDSMSRLAVTAARSLNADKGSAISTLATPYTVKSQRFQKTIEHYLRDDGIEIRDWNVDATACPLLVSIVEEGFSDHELGRQAVAHYLQFVTKQTRVLLLGCTHFPRLTPLIAEELGRITGRKVVKWTPQSEGDQDACLIIEPSIALEWTMKQSWFANQPDLQKQSASSHKVYCTDDAKGFERTAKVFCKDLLPAVEKVSLSL